MSADAHDIQSHIKTYMMIFGALLVLTVVTVAVSYLDLSIGAAIVVAFAVAGFKGSLVAYHFMHLRDEHRSIYRILLLAAAFFIVLMTIPISWWSDEVGSGPIWDQAVPATRSADPHGDMIAGHGGHGDHGDTAGDDGHGHGGDGH